jgi:chaperonin GroES
MKKQKVNFIPGRGKYLVRVQDAPPLSKGGILLPDTAKEKPMEGVILSVGPKKKQSIVDSSDYFLNDVILFGRYSGTEVTVDDGPYLIIDEEDILGKRL